MHEGEVRWPGWFVLLGGSFVAIRRAVPASNSVPLAFNSEQDPERGGARLSCMGRSVMTRIPAALWPSPGLSTRTAGRGALTVPQAGEARQSRESVFQQVRTNPSSAT